MATETDTPSGSLPVHVAVIMDGNGRWAKRQGMMRVLGHRKGVEAVRRTIEAAREEGIRYLTLYAFSDENWARPRAEVEALMELLVSNLKAELPSFVKNGIRLESIGDVSRLPEGAARELEHCRRETAENKDLVLSLALSYGSQEEIRRCVVRIAQCVARGELHPQDIDRQTIESNLYTAGMPPVDLMIRTSGEMRLSNFLLWQSAYAELYFTPVLWPDFTKEDFREALRAYARRERRFGRTSDQCANDSIKHNANTNTRI
ncbi:MAG TPA: isoprenyl transferase [Bacteroidetes bacterium]|nr:isoprenyl transferase [Bacteroidota bacterium]